MSSSTNYNDINRELIKMWQETDDKQLRAEYIMKFIDLNWDLYKFQLRNYPVSWLKPQIFIELQKIFKAIKLDRGGSVVSFTLIALKFDLVRAWRYETSLVSFPYYTRAEQVKLCCEYEYVPYSDLDAGQ